MFGKEKKKNSIVSNLSSNRVTVFDFKRRQTRYESYRPPEYRLYPKLEEGIMIPLLDEHLQKLFAGNIDDGNGDVLNNLIFSIVGEGESYLARQHLSNQDMIPRLVARNKVDFEDFKNMLEQRKKELEELCAEHQLTCQLINQANGGKRV